MQKHFVAKSLSLLFIASCSFFTMLAVDQQENDNNLIAIQCNLVPITRGTQPQTHPRMPLPGRSLSTGSSTNWCGYVSATNLTAPTKNSVTSVLGSWMVPTIKATTGAGDTYCAIWVGIDGYSNNTVEQIGTAHDIIKGKARHYAWFEMYPNSSYMINGFPVNPGDVISTSVKYSGNNTFVLTIANTTRRVSFTVPTSYTKSSKAQRNCAEWIVEAPFMNTILPLTQFTTPILMFNCNATINGLSNYLNTANTWANDKLTMVTSNSTVKSTPSDIVNSQTIAEKTAQGIFSVTWNHQ